jgi:hypothetical protein
VVLGDEVTALDALGQRDLLISGEEGRLGDAVEELLERIQRGVGRRGRQRFGTPRAPSYDRLLRDT